MPSLHDKLGSRPDAIILSSLSSKEKFVPPPFSLLSIFKLVGGSVLLALPGSYERGRGGERRGGGVNWSVTGITLGELLRF